MKLSNTEVRDAIDKLVERHKRFPDERDQWRGKVANARKALEAMVPGAELYDHELAHAVYVHRSKKGRCAKSTAHAIVQHTIAVVRKADELRRQIEMFEVRP